LVPATKDPAILERNARRFYGCSLSLAIALNDGLPLRRNNTKAMAYTYQRQAAKKRGIEWAISLEEWLRVWIDSGKWGLRGVGKGRYCMARNNDTGPYKVGNVSIQLCTTNSRDGLAFRFRHQAAPVGVQA
jgi:hypothetical protein